MKLLLRRSLGDSPFWLETAHWDGRGLHGFKELARDQGNYSEARFAPSGQVFWLRDDRLYRQGIPNPLTSRPTLQFALEPRRGPLTLESETRKGPYGWTRGGNIQLLESSLTHIEIIPRSSECLVCSTTTVYRGDLPKLRVLAPALGHSYTAGPDAFYYLKKRQLFRQSYNGEPAECLFTCLRGRAVKALYTEVGIFVSQESPSRLWLFNEREVTDQLVWHGMRERLHVCSARRTPSTPIYIGSNLL